MQNYAEHFATECRTSECIQYMQQLLQENSALLCIALYNATGSLPLGNVTKLWTFVVAFVECNAIAAICAFEGLSVHKQSVKQDACSRGEL